MTQNDCGREVAPTKDDRASRIRELNDRFRRTFIGGIVAGTDGFGALPAELGRRFIKAIQEFDDFSADNDPYAEHDFGAITLDCVRVYWKIDYYDCALVEGSPDPADPIRTLRVMTIMLVSEY